MAQVAASVPPPQIHAALEALPAPARAWLDRPDPPSAFDSLAWFRTLDRACPEPTTRPFLLASADASLIALLRARRGIGGGLHLESWTNRYSCAYDPMLGMAPAAMQIELFCAALAALRPRPATLRLDCLRPDRVDIAGLAAGLRGLGWWTQIHAQFGNWYDDMRGIAADSYFAAREPRLRATIARRARRFSARADASITIAAKGAALEAALADYLATHARSWKGPEPDPGFVPEFVRRFAARDRIRIGVARIQDRPVAVQIWLRWGRRATIVKLAYDAAAAQLSPGTVLTASMIRAALGAGDTDEIDFGRGDDPYKRLWLGQRRPVLGLIAGDPRLPGGFIAALRHLAPAALRAAGLRRP